MLTLTTVALVFGLGAATNAVLDRPATRPRLARPGRVARRDRKLAPLTRRPPKPEGLETDTAETVLACALPVAALGFASALAGLAAPAWALPSVLITGYLTVPFLRDGVRKFRRGGHVIDLFDAVILPTLVLMHQLIAASLILVALANSRSVLSRTYDRSRKRLINVFGDLPKRVFVIYDGAEVEVDTRALKCGDVVVVTAGEAVPVDGVVVEGDGLVDQHLLTGESVPTEKQVGDRLFAATLVVSGRLLVRADQAGQETHASEITRLVLSAADRRLMVQERGERIAEQSLPIMLALAVTAGLIGGVVRAIAVVMVTPGYTMRVLAPLALLRALRRAADGAILVKDGRSLELLRDVDTVVFDKTGTLTDGSLRVAEVVAADGFAADTVLEVAAIAEGRQSHPIAAALRAAAAEAAAAGGATTPASGPGLDEADYTVGRGIRARVRGRRVLVGSRAFLADHWLKPSAALEARTAAFHRQGLTCVLVGIDGWVAGVVAFDQVVRPDACATVAALKRRGIETAIISGDGAEATRHLADLCGIDAVYAETLPGDKARIVEAMQAGGRTVCFIGDGINDAGALKQASVSVSIRGASTVATDTAQIVLLSPSLGLMTRLFEISDGYEGATAFASRLAVWLPAATVPLVFFGYGGVILVIAAHQAALWSGFMRILTSNRIDAGDDAASKS